MHTPTFTVIFVTLLFVGWWSGVDYLEREFMPAFWFISSLALAAMMSILAQKFKDDK